jgi:hypothetical protein
MRNPGNQECGIREKDGDEGLPLSWPLLSAFLFSCLPGFLIDLLIL